MVARPGLDGAIWRKSRACADGNSCVEVARIDGWVAIRDSKDPDKDRILMFDDREWHAFLTGVHAGDFDSDQESRQ
jgi:hypothetical protein